MLKMMVHLLDLWLVIWFVNEPPIDDDGEMMIVMETIQLDFFMKIYISPFGAPMVCINLQVV
jgi:hypothetical protein